MCIYSPTLSSTCTHPQCQLVQHIHSQNSLTIRNFNSLLSLNPENSSPSLLNTLHEQKYLKIIQQTTSIKECLSNISNQQRTIIEKLEELMKGGLGRGEVKMEKGSGRRE